MRMMHILCSALTSRDGESSATGSVVTIRQRAIETIYEGCLEGWGSESVDETVNSDPQKSSNKHLWFFNSGETDASWGSYSLEDGVMNYSKFKGLYNTGHLWDILDGGNMSLTTNSSYTTRNVQWNSYLDFVRKNDYSYQGNDDNVRINFLREDPEIMTMRYTCMMRNRDNNGNGIIDAEEVRWYLASTEQLMALYLGDLGLNNIAKLYYTEDDDNVEKGVSGDMYYPWRIHVVSSTRSPENLSKPEMIWAEEGCSTSAYGSDWGKSGLLSIRCVRNLGHDQDVPGDLPYDIENPNSYPQSPVLMKASDNNHDANTIYRFNMESLNSASRRIRVSTELITLDENSEMARVYKGFETGPLGREGSSFGSVTDFPAMKNDLIDGYSQCPEGYRMPNIREATIMYNYIPSTSAFWGERLYFVNNYYSFGSPTVGGNGYDGDTYTWSFSSNRIMLSGSGMFIRCVRDIEPEDYSWD